MEAVFFLRLCFEYMLYILVKENKFLCVAIIFVDSDCCPLQTSGSLYGALIGSVLAFNVADFLG